MSRMWSPAAEVARDKLFDQLMLGGIFPAEQRWQMIDDFAHALAEQQRAFAEDSGMALDDGPYVSLGDVIDSIDPRPVSSEEKNA